MTVSPSPRARRATSLPTCSDAVCLLRRSSAWWLWLYVEWLRWLLSASWRCQVAALGVYRHCTFPKPMMARVLSTSDTPTYFFRSHLLCRRHGALLSAFRSR
jgi:hypothetical protein